MSSYNPNLGFIPSTSEELISNLRSKIESVFGIKYPSDTNFLASNIYMLFEGFASIRMDLENDVVKIINNFFQWMKDNKIKIGFGKNGTVGGLKIAFGEKFTGVAFKTGYKYKEEVPPGVALVCIDNSNPETDEITEGFTEEERKDIAEIFGKYWPLSILTFNGEPPAEGEDGYTSVEVDFKNEEKIQYFFRQVELVPLKIQIEWRGLPSAIIPTGEDKALKEAFMKSFNMQKWVGKNFEPHSYLSTQNVEWLAEARISYSLPSDKDDPPYPHTEPSVAKYYYQKFVVARTEGGAPDIAVKPMGQ